MHELSFARQVIESILGEVTAWPDRRITRIRLRSPDALALEPASLRFALEALSADTQAEGAVIEIIEEGGMAVNCPACGRIAVDSLSIGICPRCDRPCEVIRDTALVIEEIELDV